MEVTTYWNSVIGTINYCGYYVKGKCLPTIFTSNCDSEQLKMDDRTVDRIVSISTDIKMPERSIRREKAEEANRKFIMGLMDKEK